MKKAVQHAGRFLLLLAFINTALPLQATQIEPTVNSESSIRTDLFELTMFPGWFQPMKQITRYKGNSRVVVKLLPDGSAILNPPDEGFGWSSNNVDIKSLSEQDACDIWGEKRGETFDLLANPRPKSNDFDVFHLDTKFENNRLNSYRLRGIGISNPEWKKVP